jgi:hypothetical protein
MYPVGLAIVALGEHVGWWPGCSLGSRTS